MPSTKPIFMDVIIYNSSTQKYAGLYFKSEKVDGSGTAEDQFYWINTNSSGDIIDWRSNMLNGWYSSKSLAEANKPSGYTDNVPANLNDKFMVGFMPAWYTDGNVSGYPYKIDGVIQENNPHKYTLDAIDKMLDAGITYLKFAINMSYIYFSKSDYDIDTAGGDANAMYNNSNTRMDKYVKNAIDLIVSKGKVKQVAVSFRLETMMIREGWNDMRNWNPRLINDSDLMVDNTGNIASGIYARGSLSYCSANALQIAKDFIRNVLRRYKSYANDRGINVHWVSVVNSQTSEAEYGYENAPTIGGSTVQRLMDYSDNAVVAFRAWLQSTTGGNYASISALNTAWGTSFAGFNSINRENLPAWGITDDNQVNNFLFSDKKGKDWYNFSVYKYVSFYKELKTLVNSYTNNDTSTVKFMLESGTDLNHFIDPSGKANGSSYKRFTTDQSKIQECYDYHKSWCSFYPNAGDVRNAWGAFQVDFARTNAEIYNKKMGTELYANDFVDQQGISPTVSAITDAFKGVNTALIKNQIKEILYIAPNGFQTSTKYQFDSALNGVTDAISQIKSISTYENPTTEVTFTMDYLHANGTTAVFNLWKAYGGSTSNRLRLRIGDITSGGGGTGGGGTGGGGTGGGTTCTGDVSYTIYSDSQGAYHQYCLGDRKYRSNVDNAGSNNGGNKYYNFDSAGKYTGTEGGLSSTHFVFALPTHSITNDNTTTSTLVLHQVEIYDNSTNALLFKNTQFRGYRKTGDNSGNFNLNNSHPSNGTVGASPIYLSGDSTFFFELNRNYKIIITNLGGVFTTKLENINTDANTYRNYYEGKLSSGSLTITINPTKILTVGIRGLKLILDRFSNTDTISTTNNLNLLAP